MAQDKMEVKNGRLIIDVAIDEEGRPSKSGKTILHFTTAGEKGMSSKLNNRPVFVNINCYSK